jgi:hypothetical protein
MVRKFSAYLSIYNDWDMLAGALSSIADKVDELVVVDGAYEWMAPFYAATGRDPEKSDDRVYDILASSGIPYRVIRQGWKNEIEKRVAGFASCEGRYVCRVDSDEIMFFNDDLLDLFFKEGKAVADIETPQLVAPGWMFSGDPIGRLGFLFDREQIEAKVHLNYLWLVLTSDQRPAEGQQRAPVFSTPVGYNMHLTEWRSWKTAVNRAAFYHLNYMRGHGVPFIAELAKEPLIDLGRLFDIVAPATFAETLLTNSIVTGSVEIPNGLALRQVPLSAAQQAIFNPCYEAYVQELAVLNRRFTETKTSYLGGNVMTFDLSTAEARDAIIRDGVIVIEAGAKILSALAKVNRLSASELRCLSEPVEFAFHENRLTLNLKSLAVEPPSILRTNLQVQIWVEGGPTVDRFQVIV